MTSDARFDGFVMAIGRHARTVREQVAHTVLHAWDALLVLIPRDRLEQLRKSEGFIVLAEVELALRRSRLWWLPLGSGRSSRHRQASPWVSAASEPAFRSAAGYLSTNADSGAGSTSRDGTRAGGIVLGAASGLGTAIAL